MAAAEARKVVILGGGLAGMSAARVFEDASAEEAALVDVTLVSKPGPCVVGAVLPQVAAGSLDIDDWVHVVGPNSMNLDRVKFVCGTVVGIDTEAKTVSLKGGARLAYDELVVALGMSFNADAVPGLADNAYNVCCSSDVVEMQGGLATLGAGATVVVSVTRLPYKCPPVPFEYALLIKQAYPELNVVVTTPMGSAVPVFAPHVLEGQLADAGIEFQTNKKPTSVDGTTKTVAFEDGTSIAYDLLAAVFPQSAPAVVQNALPCDDPRGFVVPANPYAARSPVPNVYVAGDNASMTFHFEKAGMKRHPKAGKFAIEHGRTAARAIIADAVARAAGETVAWDAPRYVQDHGAECEVAVSSAAGVRVSLNFYDNNLKPVVSMTEDPAAEIVAAKAAWIEGLYKEMFRPNGE